MSHSPTYALLTLLLSGGALQGGTISGQVVGVDKQPAANRVVTIRKLDTGRRVEAVTDVDGRFRFDQLSPGTYGLDAGDSAMQGSALVNLGPTEFEKRTNVAATVQLSPVVAGGASNGSAFALVALLAVTGSLWWYDRANLFFLRVPLLGLTLWACLLPMIAWLDTQNALLLLDPRNAFQAGRWFSSSAWALWLGREAIRCSLDAPRPKLPDWATYASGTAYGLTLVLAALILAITAMRSGTPEPQGLFVGGAVLTFIGSYALLEAATWMLARWFNRSVVPEKPTANQSGQRTALVVAIVYLGLIVTIYLFESASRDADLTQANVLPGSPLAHLFALLAISALALSLACVVLDPYRVPLLSLGALFAVGAVLLGHGDYYFVTQPVVADTRPTPAETIAGHDRVIAVAVSGGGVQAAAWSARVLGALREEVCDFASHVRLISSVSGGSVGTLHFLGTYGKDQGGLGLSSKHAFDGASAPMLETLSRALVRRDLPRSMLFLGQSGPDRGRVLDQALAARSGFGATRLSTLGSFVPRGLPAVILNATEVETGQPIGFSSTKLSQDRVVDFLSTYRRDVEAVTATRLSATFPYVSPAARARTPQGLTPHFADGGYYDNFGMFALMSWLDQALPQKSKPRLLVIRIEAFPESAGTSSLEPASWPFQLFVPVATLSSVRTVAQVRRNESEFARFQQNYQYAGGEAASVLFRYQRPISCPEPPLSWDLTPVEINCIERAWHLPAIQSALAHVNSFLQRQQAQ